VAAMTLARRISISTKDLKLLVERMTTISSDAQEKVVTHGLSVDEKINAADTTQWNSLITEFGNRINPNIRPTQQENNRRYLEIIDEFLKKKTFSSILTVLMKVLHRLLIGGVFIGVLEIYGAGTRRFPPNLSEKNFIFGKGWLIGVSRSKNFLITGSSME
jgi:hypothetical protein